MLLREEQKRLHKTNTAKNSEEVRQRRRELVRLGPAPVMRVSREERADEAQAHAGVSRTRSESALRSDLAMGVRGSLLPECFPCPPDCGGRDRARLCC
jgi:hypothetical protein